MQPRATLIAVLGLTLGPMAYAQSPVGLWRTIDDQTGKERSLVRITETGGVLSGKIEKIADPTKQDARCDECTDERKGQPVLGMTIIRNVKRGEGGVWEGGDILDPNNGKVYRVRLTPIEDGKKLQVRGFLGVALLGRTQTWVRVE
ncbi:MAG: DUF2147 domain-containing protein [Casimicrobiaceae bacterium]